MNNGNCSYNELLNQTNTYDIFSLPGICNEMRLLNNKAHILIEKEGSKKINFIKIYKKDFYIENKLCEQDMLTIKHPNLVNLNDVRENDKYKIFEYKYHNTFDLYSCITNTSIYNIIKDNNNLDKLSEQLINVINYLHINNICHRDIKIDNISGIHIYNISKISFLKILRQL